MQTKIFMLFVMVTLGCSVPGAYCIYFMEATTTVPPSPPCQHQTCSPPPPTNVGNVGTHAATLDCGDVYNGTIDTDKTGNVNDITGPCQDFGDVLLLKFEDFTTSYTRVAFDTCGSVDDVFLFVMSDVDCDGVTDCLGYENGSSSCGNQADRFEDRTACAYWLIVKKVETIAAGKFGLHVQCF